MSDIDPHKGDVIGREPVLQRVQTSIHSAAFPLLKQPCTWNLDLC